MASLFAATFFSSLQTDDASGIDVHLGLHQLSESSHPHSPGVGITVNYLNLKELKQYPGPTKIQLGMLLRVHVAPEHLV